MSRTKQQIRMRSGTKRKFEDQGSSAQPSGKRPPTTNSRPQQTSFDPSIAEKDPDLLADHFAKSIKRHLQDATSIEVDDQCIPTSVIRDTTDFHKPRIAGNLPVFLERYTDGGRETLSTSNDVAGPHTIVISSSGIRTADLTRDLRIFGSDDSAVAKFIAKHMKLKDNLEYVQKTRIGIAIGTPKRLQDLVEGNALKLAHLRRIVIDASYQDEKKRSIFDMAELFNPMISFLNLEQVKSRYKTDPKDLEILIF